MTAVAPAAAQARPSIDGRLNRAEVRFGARNALSGRLHDGTRPLAGQPVELEGREYPFTGDYRELATATTDASGAFAFRPAFARNAQLRVWAPALHLVTPVLESFTYPAFKLTYVARRPGVVELRQRYRVPRGVALTAPTRFYLGPRGARRSTLSRSAATHRVGAGRFASRVTVRLPRTWGGRFRFGSCFVTSPGSGMGRADASCPARYRF